MVRALFLIVLFLMSNFAEASEDKIVTFLGKDKKNYFPIPGIGNVKRFPVQKFYKAKSVTKETEEINVYRSKTDSNYIKVIFGDEPDPSGIFLIDSSGNTTTSISKGLFMEEGGDLASCRGVVSSDFNGDGKKDYFIDLENPGNGIADTHEGVLLLSDGNSYKAMLFTTYGFKSGDFVDLFNDGRCFLLIVNPTWANKLVLPPKDSSELAEGYTKKDVTEYKKGVFPPAFAELYFYVYYPVEIKETKLIIANYLDKRFPVFKSWYRWSRGGSEGETSLISNLEKKKIWKENKTIMAFPLRDKIFLMPSNN